MEMGINVMDEEERRGPDPSSDELCPLEAGTGGGPSRDWEGTAGEGQRAEVDVSRAGGHLHERLERALRRAAAPQQGWDSGAGDGRRLQSSGQQREGS